jgi:hypothetical protein
MKNPVERKCQLIRSHLLNIRDLMILIVYAQKRAHALTTIPQTRAHQDLSACSGFGLAFASTLTRLLHFEVSISAPRLDLGSKSQQILTLAWQQSIWDFQSLGTKARALPVDFSDTLDIKPVR